MIELTAKRKYSSTKDIIEPEVFRHIIAQSGVMSSIPVDESTYNGIMPIVEMSIVMLLLIMMSQWCGRGRGMELITLYMRVMVLFCECVQLWTSRLQERWCLDVRICFGGGGGKKKFLLH